MFAVTRVLLAVCGGLAFIAGLIVVSAGGPAAPDGIWPLVLGGALLIAVVLERQRYRSEAAERLEVRPGPGGGEPEALPARFQRTEERFVDPTTNLVMRVFLDPRTGERRYRTEEASRG